jgi:hypothetical protein
MLQADGVQASDLGQLKKIRVGHDNSSLGPAWFLEKVVITNQASQQQWFFLCGKWLAKDEDDGQIIRELPASDKDGVASLPMVNYKLSIMTGDRKGAGTNANILVTIYGKNGDTGKRVIDAGSKKFQRAQTDVVGIEVQFLQCDLTRKAIDLGEITKIRIGHDGKGFGSSWFLDKVTLSSPTGRVISWRVEILDRLRSVLPVWQVVV